MNLQIAYAPKVMQIHFKYVSVGSFALFIKSKDASLCFS